MLPSETMIWQPEFTDKTLSRKPGAVHRQCIMLRKKPLEFCTKLKPKIENVLSEEARPRRI
ncbi:hypothetical protein [Escherichia coli]|uniref:hypothetical protein n=1 Tax=Escherichia coli TaxID=562 RepID=UPI000BDF11EC|nr:hypothetical protein [Escherichia coli]